VQEPAHLADRTHHVQQQAGQGNICSICNSSGAVTAAEWLMSPAEALLLRCSMSCLKMVGLQRGEMIGLTCRKTLR